MTICENFQAGMWSERQCTKAAAYGKLYFNIVNGISQDPDYLLTCSFRRITRIVIIFLYDAFAELSFVFLTFP